MRVNVTVLWLLLYFTLALIVGCGCSFMTAPLLAYPGDNQDTWPAVFGTDAGGGVDNLLTVFYDQGGAVWDAPRLQDNNVLQLQMLPGRNNMAQTTGGKWNVTYIRDTAPNAVVTRECPDTSWLDEAGVWADLDTDNSEEWLAVDVETRQNYIWAAFYDAVPNPDQIRCAFIDLLAVAPNWTFSDYDGDGTTDRIEVDDYQYSISLNTLILGLEDVAYRNTNAVRHAAFGNVFPGSIVLALGEYPQVIDINDKEIWVFCTSNNTLYCSVGIINPNDQVWSTAAIIFTAHSLGPDYHVAWSRYDDTVHIVLVDFEVEATARLIYIKRTANFLSAPVVLLTVDTTSLGNHETITWPQITLDSVGNVMIRYIREDLLGAGGGDLQAKYLDVALASVFDIPGNWVTYTDIDGSETLVTWVSAPEYVLPVSDA